MKYFIVNTVETDKTVSYTQIPLIWNHTHDTPNKKWRFIKDEDNKIRNATINKT